MIGGDKVLTLLAVIGSTFQAKFLGPNTVVSKVSDLNYVFSTPDCKKSVQWCHIYLLKPYFSDPVLDHSSSAATAASASDLMRDEMAAAGPIERE